MNSSYPIRLLASCSVCSVEHSVDNGMIQLHIDHTTLYFRPAAFTLMCETLLSALSRVAPELVVVTRMRGSQTPSNH